MDIVLVEPVDDALASSTSDASISASQFDPTPSNDSGEATAPMPAPGAPAADLDIQDHESSPQDTLGGTLIDTAITVVNNGPGEATGVDLTDALDAAARVVADRPRRSRAAQVLPSNAASPTWNRAQASPWRSACVLCGTGPLMDDVTASDRAVRSELRQRFREDSRHDRTQRHGGEGADRGHPTSRVITEHVVGFVVTVGVIKPVPGVKPTRRQ